MVHFKEIFLKFMDEPLKVLFGKNKYSKTLFVKELRKGDSVYLKTPNNIPQKVLDDLSGLFEKQQSILLAYLAEGFLEVKEPPHYIVGTKIDQKTGVTIEQLMESMAKELNGIIPKGFYVDFIAIDDKDTPINNFMKNYLIPFYSRSNKGDGSIFKISC